ncbi:hypothetical protein HWC21_gp042 [Vibrio phage VAP7]|uniref:Uncharacterized protein n=1 Tax=Vibrio phage VAP7 TaxID=2584487 RepID=A0A4Y5TV28_9CAUD|nr:hypothetical protein HWC21_gp042 [Vibrio phage VAP7]QDB73224.1 hypothetical protein [Vibrio phage VAP7]
MSDVIKDPVMLEAHIVQTSERKLSGPYEREEIAHWIARKEGELGDIYIQHQIVEV